MLKHLNFFALFVVAISISQFCMGTPQSLEDQLKQLQTQSKLQQEKIVELSVQVKHESSQTEKFKLVHELSDTVTQFSKSLEQVEKIRATLLTGNYLNRLTSPIATAKIRKAKSEIEDITQNFYYFEGVRSINTLAGGTINLIQETDETWMKWYSERVVIVEYHLSSMIEALLELQSGFHLPAIPC